MTKWDEKDVMEHAKNLKSPFDTLGTKSRIPSPGSVLEAMRARGNGNLGQPLEIKNKPKLEKSFSERNISEETPQIR